MKLEIESIRIDGGTQPREKIVQALVKEYAREMKAGAEFPPVVVFFDGANYWLADGFHRLEAVNLNGWDSIDVDVHQGTRRDAVLCSVSANTEHGQRRSNSDKRRAVMTLLNDAEWQGWSSRKIGRTCRVSHTYVDKLRPESSFYLATLPDRDIADEPKKRKFRRGGKTHEMNVSNIGKAKEPEPPEEPPQEALELRTQTAPPLQIPKSKATLNQTNENIEWAKWTWNPVTGCEFNCPYCYARDIGIRFQGGFEPTYHADRLIAPHNKKVPTQAETDIGYKNVFVCSMGELFGDWVPQKWIDDVLLVVRSAPQWNFLFLTKNPKRLVGIDWPENAWVGTTVDVQARVEPAQEAFRQLNASVKFLSCEPLQEQLDFDDMSMFDWLIIGGRSKSAGMPAFQPEMEWVKALTMKAWNSGLKVYWKPNLTRRPREYPEG